MVKKITEEGIMEAAKQRLVGLRRRERAARLKSDLAEVRGASSSAELEARITKHNPVLMAIGGSIEFASRSVSNARDMIRQYGPAAAQSTLRGLGKGANNVYNGLVVPVTSRVYGTLDRTLSDLTHNVGERGVEALGNVTVAGINVARQALLYLALLGSVMYAVEAYRPGTVGRLMRETPANMVRGVQSAIQEIYKAFPKPKVILPQEPLPRDNYPVSPRNTTKAA